MKENPVLAVSRLCLRFNSKNLFDDLSFTLNEGEKATIYGKSGSGKTTLLKCLLGFSFPDSGTIKIKGKILSDHSIWEARKAIGFVPQDPDLGDRTVSEFLRQPFSYKANKSLRWENADVDELLLAFHLEKDILRKKSRQLSGGEKQRIALLSSLLLKRDIYLLDEVTSALDDETRMAVIAYLKQRNKTTFLFVSHDQDVKEMSQKTIFLRTGRTREEAS